MKRKCFTEFLCEDCFNILATVFVTVLILLFVGIIFYSLGLPMHIFYTLLGIGFFVSLALSLNCIRKKHIIKRKCS